MSNDSRAAGASVSVFHLSSPERARRVARALADATAEHGVAGFGFRKCLEIVARMYGHRGYRDLTLDCGKHPSSADDAVAGETISAARRAHHERILIEAGIARFDAIGFVLAVAPTGRADPRKASVYRRLDPDERSRVVAARRYLQASVAQDRRIAGHWGEQRFDDVLDDTDIFYEISGDFRHEAVMDLLDLHDAGLSTTDLKSAYLANLTFLLSVSDDRDDPDFHLPQRTASELYDWLRRHEAAIGTAADEDRFADFLDGAGFMYRAFQAAKRSVMEATDHVTSVVAAFDRIVAADLSLADVAVWMASTSSGAGVARLARLNEEYPLLHSLPDRVSQFDLVTADVADGILWKAFDGMLERGVPTCFGFASGIHFCDAYRAHAIGHLRDGVPVIDYDLLVSAHVAGFGMRDFATSAAEAARRWFADNDNGHASNAGWAAMFGNLPDLGGRYDRDLAIFALTHDFIAHYPAGPDKYRAGLDMLVKLADAGMTLADMGAYLAIDRLRDHEHEIIAEVEAQDQSDIGPSVDPQAAEDRTPRGSVADPRYEDVVLRDGTRLVIEDRKEPNVAPFDENDEPHPGGKLR